jgi:hypothetical protein
LASIIVEESHISEEMNFKPEWWPDEPNWDFLSIQEQGILLIKHTDYVLKILQRNIYEEDEFFSLNLMVPVKKSVAASESLSEVDKLRQIHIDKINNWINYRKYLLQLLMADLPESSRRVPSEAEGEW